MMLTNEIKFTRLADDVILPSKREEDGCFDIYAHFAEESVMIGAHEVALIPTGLRSTFEKQYRIAIRERGSNIKGKMIVMAGQIDSNYTGEWFVAIYNGGDRAIIISKSVDKCRTENGATYVPYSKAIAQFAVEIVPDICLIEISNDEMNCITTDRGAGCLGSSGK